MVLKTWGGIWGANGFKNMGWNMGCQYKEVFNHFFGEDTPSDAWHDFYKVSIDVYIETSDFVGISHREYINVWANNSPTSAFWYQVPTANCTGGNS